MTREFFAAQTVRELEQQSDYWLEEQGRLTEPMRYDPATDHYVPVAWDEAFALIGRELRALDDPERGGVLYLGPHLERGGVHVSAVRARFGTNNFPDCSNMCHEPTSVGLPESIGIGKGTVLLDDFAHAEAIFILGQNPGTNSPRMMTELHNASRRGVPIVVFNPLRSARSSASPRRRIRSRWRRSARRGSPASIARSGRRRCRGAQGRHEAGARSA